MTLWGQYTNKPSCCETWMGTTENDPDFSGSGNFGTGSVTPVAVPMVSDAAFTWSMPLAPGLSQDIQLGTGPIVAVAFLGDSEGAGDVMASTVLKAGGKTIATGAAQAVQYAAQSKQVTWTMTPTETSFGPADGNLVWEVSVTGTGQGAYMGFTGATHSHITMPVLSVGGTKSGESSGAKKTFESISAAQVDLQKTFTVPTTAVAHYNWTTDASSLVGSFKVARTNGTVAVKVLDAVNTTVVERSASASGSANLTITGAKAGKWQIVLTYTGFSGNVSLGLSPVVSDSGSPASSGTSPGTSPGTTTGEGSAPVSPGGSTGSPTAATSSSAKSPGLGPVLVLALVAALAVTLRRRW